MPRHRPPLPFHRPVRLDPFITALAPPRSKSSRVTELDRLEQQLNKEYAAIRDWQRDLIVKPKSAPDAGHPSNSPLNIIDDDDDDAELQQDDVDEYDLDDDDDDDDNDDMDEDDGGEFDIEATDVSAMIDAGISPADIHAEIRRVAARLVHEGERHEDEIESEIGTAERQIAARANTGAVSHDSDWLEDPSSSAIQDASSIEYENDDDDDDDDNDDDDDDEGFDDAEYARTLQEAEMFQSNNNAFIAAVFDAYVDDADDPVAAVERYEREQAEREQQQ